MKRYTLFAICTQFSLLKAKLSQVLPNTFEHTALRTHYFCNFLLARGDPWLSFHVFLMSANNAVPAILFFGVINLHFWDPPARLFYPLGSNFTVSGYARWTKKLCLNGQISKSQNGRLLYARALWFMIDV